MRKLILLIPLVAGLLIRVEWMTSVSTILIGVVLIAGYDLAIKPLHCYEQHLNNCLHGRTRECELPFLRLSENIDLVDGVRYDLAASTAMVGSGRNAAEKISAPLDAVYGVACTIRLPLRRSLA